MTDTSIVYLPGLQGGRELAERIVAISYSTFAPCRIILPVSDGQLAPEGLGLDNVTVVACPAGASVEEQLDAALPHCQGEYTALATPTTRLGELWLEGPLHALHHDTTQRRAFRLQDADPDAPAGVYRTDALAELRRRHGDVPLKEALRAEGVSLCGPDEQQFPFQLDRAVTHAEQLRREGRYDQAATLYLDCAKRFGDALRLTSLAAWSWYYAGAHERSLELCRKVNAQRPTVDTLLLEGKVLRRLGRPEPAMRRLLQAREILTA